MRILAVSDLHADFPENRRFLEAVPTREHRGDALIVAGDVADSLDVLTGTLERLRERFAELFFVPGNHDLWVRGEARDSAEKLHAVLEACAALDVRTRPAKVGGAWVVPLLSWYHEDFDVAGEGDAAELEAWADRYFCRWPPEVERPDRWLLAMNEPFLRPYDAPVVSFSHFVPRPDLLPPVRWLRFKGLPLVAGTAALDAQVRKVGATVHVYGHTHINEDRVVDGVRYVQSWLRATPGEARPPLKVVWDSGEPGAGPGPLGFC